jgi:hypothetical protein
MKKFFISGLIILAVFMFSKTISGQSSEEQEQQQTERLENLREQWRDMSEEERDKLRSEMRNRAVSRALSLQVQLQVIETIEEQVAKLKAAVKSMSEGREQYRNMSQEQRSEYREKMGKIAVSRQEAITAIEKQLERLRFRGQRQQLREPQIHLNELQEIQQLAIKEKAPETAKRLQSFISDYQKRQSQTQNMMQIIRQGRTERAPTRRQPESELQEEQ